MTLPGARPERRARLRLLGSPRPDELPSPRPFLIPRSPRVPRFVATMVALAGIVSLLSAASVPLHQRTQVLTRIVPLSVRTGATSVAALAGLGLLVVAGGLARRQRIAWWVGLGLLVVGGVSQMLKDLDVATAALALALAVVLIVNRREFDARTGPGTIRRALVAAPTFAAAVWLFGTIAIVSHADDLPSHPGFGSAAMDSLRGVVGLPMTLDPTGISWLPGLLPLLGVVAAVAVFAAALRPVVEGLRRSPADDDVAAELVRRHGADTLAYFSLRSDKSYFFEGDGLVAYRYLWNLGLCSGDPICAPEDRERTMEAFVRHARGQGWGVAVLAGSEEAGEGYRRLGLRPFYLGDEAVLDLRTFTVEGRQIRKVRQSIHRLERAGYTLEFLHDVEVDPDLRDALEGVTRAWRGRAPERGFTMSLDRLASPQDPDAIVVVARDADGRAQGFLHLVPCYGDEPGYSLAQMRRRPETPNGLTEWMIAMTALELAARGSVRFSLNFSVRGRLFDDAVHPSLWQRAEAAVLGWLNPVFQIERLRRFNEKFDPVWVPRYIYYEAPLSLPRVVLAYLEIEALVQIPLIGSRGRLRARRLRT
ncbi:MAG: bifunctional lysylphosphatidylglycerol flippase/synthetase MprF [Actinomycetota bacterium]